MSSSIPDTVRIAYTADWHVLEAKGADGSELIDQSSRTRALVQRLNDLAPDLVIHGGDLITRYDFEKKPLPDDVIQSQYAQIDGLLEDLDVPIAVFPGNHDVAFPVCREEWERRFGPSGGNGTWDRSVVLGPVQLLLMDGFATYDPESGSLTGTSLTNQQVDWLVAQSSTEQAPWRVLALHYDYKNQVLPRLAELGIDCFLYGHSVSHEAGFFEQSGARNGHLPGRDAYRMLTITPDTFELAEPIGYEALESARA